ncbi:peroxiredoxin-like family protein [Mycolicibacterium tusciae]|jgi:peroxiredoxin|uniref:Alkyl hydroperoxide reductase n=1 Tax=Mycolicibacterium tusciae TaxID=75922 RepID=A0A1X0JLT2_9MYCO|nr:peroxiredoxin-like family protein [Mycolicibacterium tusciae]ORB63207.1 alkyl hydroperoxide reductase [Mycolicibacterium tusciae]
MFTAGDKVKARTLRTVTDTHVSVPAPERLVHLQFRRFAGCPICNLHLRDVARRRDEIENAGVTEVVLFHSAADRLRQYVADVPFAMVADPERKLYKEFGVESSLRSVLHLGAVRAAVRGIRHSTSVVGALAPGEDHLGNPADFLIEPDGTIRACKYGIHADDQWSVDELLKLAAT